MPKRLRQYLFIVDIRKPSLHFYSKPPCSHDKPSDIYTNPNTPCFTAPTLFRLYPAYAYISSSSSPPTTPNLSTGFGILVGRSGVPPKSLLVTYASSSSSSSLSHWVALPLPLPFEGSIGALSMLLLALTLARVGMGGDVWLAGGRGFGGWAFEGLVAGPSKVRRTR